MSSDPLMYRWSQWLFLTLLEAGLVYRGTGTVDWCDTCQTTLATIQVEDGLCWRCHNPVRLIQRPQWYLRISAYVQENDRRLAELATAASGMRTRWPASASCSAASTGSRSTCAPPTARSLTVFTPHADALGQARFVLISPKHPEVERVGRRSARARAARGAALGRPRAQRPRRRGDPADRHRPHAARARERRAAAGADLAGGRRPLRRDRRARHPRARPHRRVIAERLARGCSGDAIERSERAADRGAAGSAARGVAAHRVAGTDGRRVRYRADDFSISRQRSWGTPIPIVYCEALRRGAGADGAAAGAAAAGPQADRHRQPAGRARGLRGDRPARAAADPARRETDTLDCHFDALWLWIPACVPPERARAAAGGDPRAGGPAPLAALRAARRGLRQRQLRVRPAHRHQGAARHRPARLPRRRRALRRLPVPRDGDPRRAQDVQAPRQRRRPRRAASQRYGADTVRLAVLYARARRSR